MKRPNLKGPRKSTSQQGCIFRLTCSHRELTRDHVLTSAYVKNSRTVTRNAINKSVWEWPRNKRLSFLEWLDSPNCKLMRWIGLALICDLVLPTEANAELLNLSTTASVLVWFDTVQRNSIVHSTPVDHVKRVRCTLITTSILEELERAVNKTDAALKSFDYMRLDWRLSEIVGKI